MTILALLAALALLLVIVRRRVKGSRNLIDRVSDRWLDEHHGGWHPDR